MLSRPAFNIGYVGMNQKIAPLNNIKVREAVAYGLDKKSVVGAFYGGRGQVANQFLPPLVEGYAKKGVPDYSYNPAKAKALLQEAGLSLPVKLEFWYPTDRPRGYMPDPPRIFQAFAASLEKSGFKIVAAPGSVAWWLPRGRAVRPGRALPARLDRRLRRSGQLPQRALRRRR